MRRADAREHYVLQQAVTAEGLATQAPAAARGDEAAFAALEQVKRDLTTASAELPPGLPSGRGAQPEQGADADASRR